MQSTNQYPLYTATKKKLLGSFSQYLLEYIVKPVASKTWEEHSSQRSFQTLQTESPSSAGGRQDRRHARGRGTKPRAPNLQDARFSRQDRPLRDT